MSSYLFVHLSDIHFGQEQSGTLPIHEAVRREVLNDCVRMKDNLGPASGVLITGDIAYFGKRAEYERASAWLDQLTENIGCPRTAVQVVPGNHDVDRDEIGHMARILQEKTRGGSPASAQADLEGIAKSNEIANPLLPKLAAYREFAAQYGCDFKSAAKPTWSDDKPLREPYILRFVGLNSVLISDQLDAKGNLVLGNTQYTIDREQNVESVVMIHHPLDWFLDQVEAEQFLCSRARVIMVGHDHLPAISKVQDETGNERLVIGSGAINPPEAGGRYRYTYNWLAFSLRDADEAPQLVVTVYPRVWVDEQTDFAADRARLAGDESREFALACPYFEARPAAPEPAPVDSPVPAAEPAASGHTSGRVSDSDERFARLRHFFWRFLDWRQRLSVLVQLDILPHTTERPLPQTLERLALDSARALGKLEPLWSAVMKFVPVEERDENPFTPSQE